MERVVVAAFLCIFVFSLVGNSYHCAGERSFRRRPNAGGLCARLIQPAGYPCSEHTVQTKDGFLLALQRVSSRTASLKIQRGPPVLLQHGLFMCNHEQGGDAWFLNSREQSLGFILADHGYDVWVASVRGTHWSHGHISLTEKDKDFWDWSWQELALYDLAEMINYVSSTTNSKIFYVGHSQGTIMAFAAFTQPDIVAMVEAAALLCPISYLGHISAPFILEIVSLHLDQIILALGIHRLDFRSDFSVSILDSICDGHVNCSHWLTSITGKNCCFNNSRVDFYLKYEPQPSSSKNLNHLFQMIRKGTFAKYDYGMWGNLKRYGRLQPPSFDLAQIPKNLPLWMGYGGNDALADITDLEHTLKELRSRPQLLYLENYGHMDFIASVKAKEDIFDNMLQFLGSWGKSSSS